MRKELEHFTIDGSLGGQQEWFPEYWMKIGGCGAVTACDICIYLARYMKMLEACPFDAWNISKEDYLSFGEKMRPYLSPRPTGIDRTEIYVEGFGRYLADSGVSGIGFREISGTEDVETAVREVRAQIDRGLPVAYLMLMHRDKALDDYMWHWFLLNGYDETEERFLVKVVSYGEGKWMDLRHLWRTCRRRKGGFVLLETEKQIEPHKLQTRDVPSGE
ncbi:MAG: hypothetical protein K6C09_06115 [Oscillospiraceae bacterium]|nr:hypothetical protein [Oscillospiraceae bacterium]